LIDLLNKTCFYYRPGKIISISAALFLTVKAKKSIDSGDGGNAFVE